MPGRLRKHAEAEASMVGRLNADLEREFPDGVTCADLVQDGDVITLDEMEAELRAKGIDPAGLDHLYPSR